MLNFLKGSNFRKANNYYMSTGSMKLLAFITAGFILSIALNLHATVSVYVVPPLNRARILPDTVLPSSWLSNNLFLIACKGEYEPGSFVVCSDSTANSISVSVSNLTGSGGTIPAANVDIRVVKCWYQAGYRINDLSHKHLTPELLVKDDSLVYTEDEQNYVKLTPEGDSPYYTCVSTPDTKTGRYIASLTEFPVKDAATLQPVNLTANQNKQFWVTLQIPANATPGTYVGTITLSGGISQTIALKVWVPSITLSAPSLTYALYYLGQLRDTGSISSEDKNDAQLIAELQNLYKHGITTTSIEGPGRSLTETLTIRASQNIDDNNLYYCGAPCIYHPNLNTLLPDLISTATSCGVDQVYIYGADEENHDTPERRAQLAATHALNGKVFVAQTVSQASLVADVLDLAIVSGVPSSQLAAAYHSYGHKVFSYCNPQVGEEDPAIYRSNYGLALWQSGYDGAMDYAYQHSFYHIWNDFDHVDYRDHCFTYPTTDGVIDTIQWEGFREGVDDVRYITTLNSRIDTVLAGSDAALKRIAKSASSWLVTANPKGDMNQFRSQAIEYILRLNGMSNDSLLVGHWRLDDGTGSSAAADSSGGGNNGSLVNMDAQADWSTGRIADGLNFNAAQTQYIDCGNNATLNPADEFTIMAWVKNPTNPSQVIWFRGQANHRLCLNVNQNGYMKLYLRTNPTGWGFNRSSNSHTWNDGWHHVAVTYTSNTIKFYFDGVLDATTTSEPLLSDSLQYVRIGGGQNGTYFTGDMDEVKVYRKALSADDIKTIVSNTDLRAKWSLNEPGGSQYTRDESAWDYENAGTLTNYTNYSAAWVIGKAGGGLHFDGSSSQYVDCGSNAALNPSKAFTIMAWVKDAAASSQVIWFYGQNGDKLSFNVNQSGAINLNTRTQAQGWHDSGSGSNHSWSGWHHVAATYNGTTNTTKFYFDGVEDYSSTTVSTGPLTTDLLQYVRLGGGESSKYFSGDMDEAKVYSRDLSAAEIKSEFNNGSLMAKWSFSETVGVSGIVMDSSGNGNHGTMLDRINFMSSTSDNGKVGPGLHFNGSEQQVVECGNSTTLNPSNEFTIMGWVKDAASSSQVILFYGQNGSKLSLKVNHSGGNGSVNLWMRTQNQQWHLAADDNGHASWSGWHHVAATYNGTTNTVKLYFDGNNSYTSTTSSTGPLTNDSLQYVSLGGYSPYFTGDMDEVKVYSKVLTGTEITEIYNAEQ